MTTTEQLHADATQLATAASAASARRIEAEATVRYLVTERDQLLADIETAQSDLDGIRFRLDDAEVYVAEAERAEKQARTCADAVASEAASG